MDARNAFQPSDVFFYRLHLPPNTPPHRASTHWMLKRKYSRKRQNVTPAAVFLKVSIIKVLNFQQGSVLREGRSWARSQCSDDKKGVERMVTLRWDISAHFQRTTGNLPSRSGEKRYSRPKKWL